MPDPRHHIFAYVDIEGSSGLATPDKEQAQKDLAAMLETACAKAGVNGAAWEDRGDGYLLVSRADDVPLRTVVAAFAGSLDAALAARTVGQTRLRLRLIVHNGEILRGERGWRGPGLDHAARLVDAPEVKQALKDTPDGRMAFVIAPELYRSVVRGYEDPDPVAFRKRRLSAKEGTLEAWLTITGAAVQPGREADEETASPAPAALPGQTINTVGNVTDSQIGNTAGHDNTYRTDRTAGQ